MSKVVIQESTLTNIGAAIREMTGKSDLIAPGDMPTEIRSIETGGGSSSDGLEIPEKMTINLGGYYLFSGDWASWLLNDYADRIYSINAQAYNEMFSNCPTLVNAGITITPASSMFSAGDMGSMFNGCYKVKTLPTINGEFLCSSIASIFFNCYELEEIPETFYQNINFDEILESTYSWSTLGSSRFYNCRKLREIPNELLVNGQYSTNYGSSTYYRSFYNCYNLDRLENLPVAPTMAAMTSNMFSGSTMATCFQLKAFTFETNEDGTPIVVQWNKQDIQLFGSNSTYDDSVTTIYKERRGAEHMNADPTTDPDAWWGSGYANYSGYDHDAAVATLNSLPDASAYLATQSSGANYIRLPGAAGGKYSAAVNTLTDAEIAVATAKGWTVVFL